LVIAPVHYHWHLTVAIINGLLQPFVQIATLNALAFNVHAWDAYHVGAITTSPELLPTAARETTRSEEFG
jgi:hypothetical protein